MQYSGMVSHPAFLKLKKLAENPFTLTGQQALTGDRLRSFICRGKDFSLLYGTERLDADVLDGLQHLADESQVVQQFREMKEGKVLAQEILDHIDGSRKNSDYRGAGDDLSWLMVEAAGL